MDAVLLTLVAYNAILIGIGIWAHRRNASVEDFYLASRGLGPWVAGLSASASSSSAWSLLGVSGAAYAWGLPALWLLPTTVGGFLLNWCWVAPRMRRLADTERPVTVSELVAPATLGAARRRILRAAALIILFSFVFYVASQFEAAGKAFESVFGLPKAPSILLGAAIVMVYTLLGGFWAVSVTDTVQGLLMVAAALILPAVAFAAVGGIDGLAAGLATRGSAGSPLAGLPFAGAGLFVIGTFGIGCGYPGQPHVVNRFMALRDDASLRRGRVIAVSWAVVVYAGMLLLGLCARALYADTGDSEQVLFHAAAALLPPVLAGVMLAAVLSAIMSTADSQLLVAASALSHDWHLGDGKSRDSLAGSRWTVIVVLLLATALALIWRADIFSRVLFAWAALGSAFGPVLILRLTGRNPGAQATLTSMLAGFGLTVGLSLLPNTPGDAAERILPFVLALVIAAFGPRATLKLDS